MIARNTIFIVILVWDLLAHRNEEYYQIYRCLPFESWAFYEHKFIKIFLAGNDKIPFIIIHFQITNVLIAYKKLFWSLNEDLWQKTRNVREHLLKKIKSICNKCSTFTTRKVRNLINGYQVLWTLCCFIWNNSILFCRISNWYDITKCK